MWSSTNSSRFVSTVGGVSLASGSIILNTTCPPTDSVLTWVLQSLLPHTSTTGSGECVLLRNGLPCLPKKLVTKIRAWEFVDLAELLPTANASESATLSGIPSTHFSLFPGCEVVSHRKRRISNIVDWCQAIDIYMAAVVSEHPSASLKLIVYMLTIIKASQQYDGLCWRAYDTNYRLAAAASGNCTWSRLDTDLFTRFLTGRARLVATCVYCDNTGHCFSDCPEECQASRERSKMLFGTPPLKQRRNWPPLACGDFNAKGTCIFGLSCKYCHVCAECGSQHVAKECTSDQALIGCLTQSPALWQPQLHTLYLISKPHRTNLLCTISNPIVTIANSRLYVTTPWTYVVFTILVAMYVHILSNTLLRAYVFHTAHTPTAA